MIRTLDEWRDYIHEHGYSSDLIGDILKDWAEEKQALRRLLWWNHGCPTSILYGDDGEMQCPHCWIDFRRDSVDDIEAKLLTAKRKPEDKEGSQ